METIRTIRGLSRKFLSAAGLSAAVMLSGTIPAAADEDLPELGDSSTRYLNRDQEELIGKRFLRHLISDPAYLGDYEMHHYLQSLGDEIGAQADLRGTELNFNLIRDNDLNAFAVPGGYITFNTGLVLATDNEGELAAVLAHEIAHLTQRHLPRLLAKSSENKIPAIAAIIGSILVGGQAGLAGVTLSSAAIASNQLSYTRDFEREADSIGIKLLAKSAYNPRAMSTFFGKLEKYTRHVGAGAPEFLRTHPLTFNRIAESEARAQSYPDVENKSSFEYHLAKARIRALYVERQKNPVPHLRDQLADDDEGNKDAAIYGIAVSQVNDRKFAEAGKTLEAIIDKYPTHPWIQSARASIEIGSNQIEAGIQRYIAAIKHNPDQLYLNYYLAEAYINNSRPDLAKKAIRYQIRRHPDNFKLYELLSKANAGMNNLAEAHQANGEYFALLGNYEKAISALKLALKNSDSNDYLKQSITARLSDFEHKAMLQKKIAGS